MSSILEFSECPVCSGPSSVPYVEFTELAFHQCAQCSTVFKKFELSSLRSPDFYEQSYFHGRRSKRDRRFAHRVRKAKRQITSALEYVEGRTLLDVGCSFGYVLEAGRQLGLNSSGTDISEYSVEVCRDRGYDARVGTLQKLPFPNGAFSVVVMKHVLEHTPAPRAAMAEVHRVLSRGGVAVIAVPNLDYWKGKYLRRTYRYFRPDDLGQQHYVYYTRQTLTALLERCGFRVPVSSKSHWRAKRAHQSAARLAHEMLRFSMLSLWQFCARSCRMQREVFAIAVKR